MKLVVNRKVVRYGNGTVWTTIFSRADCDITRPVLFGSLH